MPRLKEAEPPRARIAATAARLFAAHGVRAVGVDRLAAESRATKPLIYRHFGSKDGVVLHWLRELEAAEDSLWERLALEHPGRPAAQLLAFAAGVAEHCANEAFRGCPFTTTLAEHLDEAHPVRQEVLRIKRDRAQRIEALCAEAAFRDPCVVAVEVGMLIEGALVAAQALASEDVVGLLTRRLAALLGAGETT